MRRHARLIGLVAVVLLVLSLVFLPLTEAKRGSKRVSVANKAIPAPASKPVTTRVRPQTEPLLPVSSQAVAFAISPTIRDLPPEPLTKARGGS